MEPRLLSCGKKNTTETQMTTKMIFYDIMIVNQF